MTKTASELQEDSAQEQRAMAQQLYVGILTQNGEFRENDMKLTAHFCRKAAALYFKLLDGEAG